MKNRTNEPESLEQLATTVLEAGKSLTLGKSASYEAARRGDIPTIRIGGRLLVPLAALRKKISEGSP